MSAVFPYSCCLNSFKAKPDLHELTYGQGDAMDLIERAGKVDALDSMVAWEQLQERTRDIADYGHELRVSLEYKPTDPRRQSFLGDMATTLLFLQECDRPNLGVTIDYCHSLMARENPGFAAFLAAKSGRLYGVHLNDGYGYQDDGLMVGPASYVQIAEFLFYVLSFG